MQQNTGISRSKIVAVLAAAAAVLLSAGLVSAASLASLQPIPREELKPRALPAKSIVAAVGRAEDPRTLIVKLRDGAKIDARGGRLVADVAAAGASKHESATARATVERLGAILGKNPKIRIERAITVPRPLLDAMRHEGELATGEELADLSQFYVVRVSSGQGIELLAELLALDEVENAYAYRDKRQPVDVMPPTPNFLPYQGYRGPAPAGIDIDAAWAKGFRGQGVTVVDVETNWNLNHEDLDHLATQTPAVPVVPQSDWRDPAPGSTNVDHGTASLGVLAAGDNNDYGTKGLVPAAKFRVVPILRQSDPLWIAPNAVVHATLAMRKGDVMLLEVEHGDGRPFEADPVELAVVRQATALGIHVVEPAGNSGGGFSLDSVLAPITVSDSGAIMVAAGENAVTSGSLHRRYVNSNCGTRVDAYAWGQNITTLGYGPQSSTLANCASPGDPFPNGSSDPNQRYTHCFGGTSGAAAIVAGAVTALEQKHAAKWGRVASVRELRNHLRLGTPGASGSCSGGIGHQPDLAYHLNLFDQGGILAHVFESPNPIGTNERFGQAIASPGDVDGDDLADIAIGTPDSSVPGSPAVPGAGRVDLISVKSGKILWTVNGTQENEHFGETLAMLGDVDGDQVGDLAVGAPSKNSSRGAVYVLSGTTGEIIHMLDGAIQNERFGAAISSVVDLDGDDVRELVVGAPGAAMANPALRGRVQVLSGSTMDEIWSEDADSNHAGSEFGFAVAGIEEVDGDAYVIVGEPGYFDCQPSYFNCAERTTRGAVRIYSMPGGQEELFLLGEVSLANFPRFGAAVAGAGDLAGDDFAFVVGAPGWTQTIASPGFGKVYIYRYRWADLDVTLLQSYTGSQRFDHLGQSVAGGFDWNGDGKRDVAAGQPGEGPLMGIFPGSAGKVFIYQGPFHSLVQQAPTGLSAASASITVRPVGPTTKVFPTKDIGTYFGTAVAVLGDTNGDGRPDIGAGEPNNADGRAFVFASGPAPATPVKPRLVAEIPAIDASGGLFGRVRFHLNASPAWAGADYLLTGAPQPPFANHPTARALVASGSPHLIAAQGTLDGNGVTSAPQLAPTSTIDLCPIVGAEFVFVITVGFDANGDGVYEQVGTSGTATVKVVDENSSC